MGASDTSVSSTVFSSEEQLLGFTDDLGVSGLESGVDGWGQGVSGLDIPLGKIFGGFLLFVS